MRIRITFLAVLTVCGLLLGATLAAMRAGAAPEGTTYYVNPAGNNANACTAPGAAACKTIAGALGKAAASGDTIDVAAGTYAERLTIDKSVAIAGAGANSTVVDGANLGRVLTVTSGVTVALSNFTVKNGLVLGNGGGIWNHGVLTLDSLTVVTNTAAYGGGIYNDGTLSITHSSILTNFAILGGGLYNFAPPLVLASLSLDNSLVSGNRSTVDGGAVYNHHGGVGFLSGLAYLLLQNGSSLGDNTADGSGGGVYSDGALTSNGSTFSANVANGASDFWGGGAIAVGGGVASSSNDLLTKNQALAFTGGGGGIVVITGALTLNNTNITDNNAEHSGGAIRTELAGVVSMTGGSLTSNQAAGLGAISNKGAMTLTNVAITQNSGNGAAGAIGNDDTGIMLLDNVRLAQNHALGGDAGAVLNSGSMSINASTLLSNTSVVGGGAIANYNFGGGGILTVTNSVLRANQASGIGGAIQNGVAASLLISNVSILSNTTGADGGGLFNSGRADVRSVIASGNIAPFGSGGGIFNITGTLSMLKSTLSQNAAGAAGPYAGGGGLYNAASGGLFVGDALLQGNSAGSRGGGLFNGSITATLDLLRVFSNTATSSYQEGGGLFNNGRLSLGRSTFLSNTAESGAGLANYGWLTVSLSLVSANAVSGGFGGGLFNFSSHLFVDSTTIHANVGSGGGIANDYGTVQVVNSTISSNQGGGISNYGVPGPNGAATLLLTNTTVSSNQSSASGGGIWNNWSATLNNVTVAYNVAGSGDGGGIFMPPTYTAIITMLNTIVAGNVSLNFGAPDCSGTFRSLGYNLLGNDHHCNFQANGVVDLVGSAANPVDPRLAPLALNGGANGTLTHGLIVGSPAVDAGSPFNSPNPTACAADDQRGVPRPAGPRCDMGAFEGSVPAPVFMPLVAR